MGAQERFVQVLPENNSKSTYVAKFVSKPITK